MVRRASSPLRGGRAEAEGVAVMPNLERGAGIYKRESHLGLRTELNVAHTYTHTTLRLESDRQPTPSGFSICHRLMRDLFGAKDKLSR